MGIELLDKTRKINTLLHNGSKKLVFSEVCQVLTEVLKSDAFIISKKGKVLGVSVGGDNMDLQPWLTNEIGAYIDEKVNERILSVLSTKENVNLSTLGIDKEGVGQYSGIIVPIYISGERLGTLLMYKNEAGYEIDDILISEYGATVVSLLLLSSTNEEQVEENRRRQVVRSAINSLSATEANAIVSIFAELEGGEGMLIASKIADKLDITRSIIVNALRKLESAGVIEARSQGMKGTYVRILNDMIYEELKRL